MATLFYRFRFYFIYSKTHFLKGIGGHFEITLPTTPNLKTP
ncbi:hypothetical protein N410_00180 [Helicobacter pylori GC26]|nr:hypothetical protein N410_00180 [Helicobacter pylori GC26]